MCLCLISYVLERGLDQNKKKSLIQSKRNIFYKRKYLHNRKYTNISINILIGIIFTPSFTEYERLEETEDR